jgi:hypothetical protein
MVVADASTLKKAAVNVKTRIDFPFVVFFSCLQRGFHLLFG